MSDRHLFFRHPYNELPLIFSAMLIVVDSLMYLFVYSSLLCVGLLIQYKFTDCQYPLSTNQNF